MNTLPYAVMALSALLLLPACDDDGHDRPGTVSTRFDRGDGAIGLDGDRVVIEAGGQAGKAVVGPDGSLTVGDRRIETGSDGEAALRAYDAAAVAMKAHAIALGRTGAEFGVDVLKDVVRGFFDRARMDEVGDRAREGAMHLASTVRELCTRLEAVHTAQQAAAALVPAFQPFAVLDAAQVRDCFEELDEDRDGERDGEGAGEQDGAAGATPGAREAAAPPAPPAT